MVKKVVNLYLLLFSTSIRCNDNQEIITAKIKKYVKIENSSDNHYNLKGVSIEGNNEEVNSQTNNLYEIIMYDHSNSNLSIDRPYALYVVINCKISLWIIQRISRFIIKSPLFYQYKFQYYDKYEKLYKLPFQKNLSTLIDDINTHVLNFISIFNNFFEIYSDSLFYSDTNILKALLSLNIKIDLMKSRIDYNAKKFNKSDYDVLQILLEEMNVFQRFLPMNCEYSSNETKTSQLFGFWILNAGNENENILGTILTNIENIGLGSVDKLKSCTTEQIFMDTIVDTTTSDPIANDVANSKVYINNATITIQMIADEVKKSFDIDVILWYYDTMLATVMKLIYYKASNLTDFNPDSIPKIKKIIDKLSENGNNIPELEGFIQLNYLERTYTNWQNKLIVLGESIKHIELDKSKMYFTMNDGEYLDKLLTRILENFDDIKCTHEYLKNLLKENDKYYIPGTVKKEKYLANVNIYESEYPESVKACAFVLNIFNLSFRAHVETHTFEADVSTLTSMNDYKVMHILKMIKNVCTVIIKHENKNYSLVKMAYNITSILENQQYDSSQRKQEIIFLLKRILNIIMVELNTYSTKYCSESKFNYLLFNNINFITYGDNNLFQKSMDNIFLARYNIAYGFEGSNLDRIIHSEDLLHLQIKFLYDTKVKASCIVEFYENIINIHWKRRLLPIKTIFLESIKLSLDPQNMFALYDIYFKFHLAVVYYEIKKVLVEISFTKLKTCFQNLRKKLSNFIEHIFPNELSAFVKDLKTILLFPLANSNDVKTEKIDASDAVTTLRKRASEVDAQFKRFNFSFSQPKYFYFKGICCFLKIILNGHTTVELLNQELSLYVNEVNKLFANFKITK